MYLFQPNKPAAKAGPSSSNMSTGSMSSIKSESNQALVLSPWLLFAILTLGEKQIGIVFQLIDKRVRCYVILLYVCHLGI